MYSREDAQREERNSHTELNSGQAPTGENLLSGLDKDPIYKRH